MPNIRWGGPNPPKPNASNTIAGGTYLRPQSTPPRPLLQPPTVLWSGASGLAYKFSVHPIWSGFPARPGVYIATRLANGIWEALYVGEAEDLANRLNNLRLHHRYASMCTWSATHLGVSIVQGGADVRRTIESDLRRALNPPCNRQ